MHIFNMNTKRCIKINILTGEPGCPGKPLSPFRGMGTPITPPGSPYESEI